MARRKPIERAPLPPMPEIEAGAMAGHAWLLAMDRLAGDGDERAAAAIRASLRTRPDLWQTRAGGSIARQAEEALIGLFGQDATRDAYARTLIRADIERLRAELLDGSTDALDGLMVSRIIACHLAVSHAEALLGQSAKDGATIRVTDWHRQHAERTNRQFTRACEAYARVRRLRGPAVAVSVGAINVNAGAATPAALPEPDAAGEAIEAGWRPADDRQEQAEPVRAAS